MNLNFSFFEYCIKIMLKALGQVIQKWISWCWCWCFFFIFNLKTLLFKYVMLGTKKKNVFNFILLNITALFVGFFFTFYFKFFVQNTLIARISTILLLYFLTALFYIYIIYSSLIKSYLINIIMPLTKKNTFFLSFLFFYPHFLFWGLYYNYNLKKPTLFFIIIITLFLQVLISLVFRNLIKSYNWTLFMHDSTWGSPLFFVKFSIGLLYPLIFILYIFILRYFFFISFSGIYFSLSYFIEYFGFILLFFCYIPVFFVVLQQYFRLKNLILINWMDCLYCIHLILIQNSIYYCFMQYIHKTGNIIENYFYTLKIYTFFFSKFSFKALIISLLLIILFFEIVFYKYIFYSFFLFISFAIFFSFLNIFSLFLNSFFTHDVCISDYLYKQFFKPKYPDLFFELFKKNEQRLGFAWALKPEEISVLNKTYKSVSPYTSKLIQYALKPKTPLIHTIIINYRVAMQTQPRYFNMFCRYTHTSTLLNTTQLLKGQPIFHNALAYLLKKPFYHGLLVENGWIHYQTLSNRENNIAYHFHDFNLTAIPYIKDIINCSTIRPYIEFNMLFQFQESLKKYNFHSKLEISPLQKTSVIKFTQDHPDIYFCDNNSSMIVAMDLKNPLKGIRGALRNAILSCTDQDYKNSMYYFIPHFRGEMKSILSQKQLLCKLEILEQLKNCTNITMQNNLWFENCGNFLLHPPLRIPSNFNKEFLTELGVKNLKNGTVLLPLLNTYLCKQNIPQLINGKKNEAFLKLEQEEAHKKIVKFLTIEKNEILNPQEIIDELTKLICL
jgi:hypothetical protein